MSISYTMANLLIELSSSQMCLLNLTNMVQQRKMYHSVWTCLRWYCDPRIDMSICFHNILDSLCGFIFKSKLEKPRNKALQKCIRYRSNLQYLRAIPLNARRKHFTSQTHHETFPQEIVIEENILIWTKN